MRTTHAAVALLLAVPIITAAAHRSAPQERAAPVTFTEHVAPIVYANCVTCHRAGEVAPFPLVTYEDVAKRAKQIARVTEQRIMPPWHAAPHYGEFADERRLTDEQIETIRAWVSRDMPRGPAGKMPALPRFTDGWQLGTPDLVLEMPEPFDVPASGPDVYRNFVLPAGLADDKWVRAVEYRPGTRAVVHHSVIAFIKGGSAANLLARDGKPGFNGAMPVAFVPGFGPAGDLDTWAVGQLPHALPAGLARPLPKNSDLVLQLHLHPTGKAERERSRIGLYFTPNAPERRIRDMGVPGLFGLLAGLDIPAGDKNFTITGRLTLPADMLALSVSPHAHYLGKEFKATATLPDGSTKPMLWIQDWDFNWQDRYYYKEPVQLPKGTVIDVTITYDNSAENPRNPCKPPRRVQWGMQSTDEMGGMRFQMVPANADAETALQQNFAPALGRGIARAAQSDAAKDAAKRFADQQQRFRDGLAAPGACEGK